MKPILFNTEMVRAIGDGRKTVTRRVVKPNPLWEKSPVPQVGIPGYWANWDDEKIYKAPYCPGDILYVRETWLPFDKDHIIDGKRYAYKADCTPVSEQIRTEYNYKWHPSIHMPKEAARLFLRVTDVRVERLNDISEAQAKAEGASLSLPAQQDPEYAEYTGGYYNAFADLWDRTIKKADLPRYGWDADPWIWVIEFERISKEEALKGGAE